MRHRAGRWEIEGNRVTVHDTERGTSDVFATTNDHHISAERARDRLQLERIRE